MKIACSHWRVVAFACLLIQPLQVNYSAEPGAGTSSLAPEKQEELLEQARQAIQAGNPETAINRYLDPLIKNFQQGEPPAGQRIFSANSLIEAIMYAGMGAAADKAENIERGTSVLDGTWSTAVHLKGYALIDLERFDEAKATLRAGIAIAPINPALWNELGAILQLEKNWPEALAAYQQAESGADLVFDDDSKEVNTMLTRALRGQGFVQIEMGDLNKATALFKRCLKLDRNDKGAKQELVYIDSLKAQQKKR
jgi:tetratricopeptide (TPR) repeat protein